jgi:hypothetical protein
LGLPLDRQSVVAVLLIMTRYDAARYDRVVTMIARVTN